MAVVRAAFGPESKLKVAVGALEMMLSLSIYELHDNLKNTFGQPVLQFRFFAKPIDVLAYWNHVWTKTNPKRIAADKRMLYTFAQLCFSIKVMLSVRSPVRHISLKSSWSQKP